MSHLGDITGRARLLLEGKDVGEVGYAISVSRPSNLIEAAGEIYGNQDLLWKFSQSHGGFLQPEGGQQIQILPRRWTLGDDYVDILVSGPVPGF